MADFGSAVGGATSIIGGAMGSDAAESAADTQAGSAAQAMRLQKQIYDQNRADLAPWRDAGGAAVGKLAQLLGLSTGGAAGGGMSPITSASQLYDDSGDIWRPNKELYDKSPEYRNAWDQWYQWHNQYYGGPPRTSGGSTFSGVGNSGQPMQKTLADFGFNQDAYNQSLTDQQAAAEADPEFGSLMRDFGISDFEKDPGYDFRMAEGAKALERSASARGGVLSGRALKEMARYGQDYASNEYDKAYNRFQTNRGTKYNMLSGLSGTGQIATNTGVAAGQNYGNTVSDLLTQIGNVKAAGQVGSSNAWSTGLNNIADMFGGGYQPRVGGY
jgi:hypothetical protein